VEREHAEHHPKVKRDRQEFCYFIKKPLFEAEFALRQRTLTGKRRCSVVAYSALVQILP
jgi:hypothetical protein